MRLTSARDRRTSMKRPPSSLSHWHNWKADRDYSSIGCNNPDRDTFTQSVTKT